MHEPGIAVERRRRAALASPGTMLFSAAIFGFVGFMLAFPEIDPATGRKIPLVVTLKWTLRGSAAAFLATALLAFLRPVAGSVLFSAAGLASAALLAVVAAWDLLSAWTSGIHPFLLIVFALWNGWTSLAGLVPRRGPAP